MGLCDPGGRLHEPQARAEAEGELRGLPRHAQGLLRGLQPRGPERGQEQPPAPRYLCPHSEIRKGGEGTLFLLESNRYKESVHLYLHFKLASDEQLKDHLAAKFLSASEELAKAKSLISNLENTLSQRNYEFERTSAEFG